MKTPLEQFPWARPVDGYQWEDATPAWFPKIGQASPKKTEPGRFLRWKNAQSLVSHASPLVEHPTLFRAFAELEPTEEAFLAFANRYGWLGVSEFLVENRDDGKAEVILSNPRYQGESFLTWKNEHLFMRRVAEVLTAIQAEDVKTLNEWFTIKEDGVSYQRKNEFGEEVAWVCISSPQKDIQLREWLWKWGLEARTEEERLLRFASGWAQSEVNKAISDRENAKTRVRILFNHDKPGMVLHIVPDTLLAAMWLQCARVLTENPTFKACEHCGQWFELSPDARRRHTKYCTPRCKVSAYRARQNSIQAP